MVSFFLYYSLLGSKQSVYFYWEVGLMEEKLKVKLMKFLEYLLQQGTSIS